MSKHKRKYKGYNIERIVGVGTGSEEGSVLASATRWGYPADRIVVVITPDFMGELAHYVSDSVADVPGVAPSPPQPVVDATYESNETADVAAE